MVDSGGFSEADSNSESGLWLDSDDDEPLQNKSKKRKALAME